MTEKALERKVVLDPNLGVFVQAVADAAAAGWTIDPQNPAGLYGYMYEVNMLIAEKPAEPMSRSESLTKARQARKAKAEASQEPETEEVEATPASEDVEASEAVLDVPEATPTV